ncbi:MAG: AcrR family transcriptional regulator [Paraglaciecola sp.]|jgi:AcrR family transcriptional regulator
MSFDKTENRNELRSARMREKILSATLDCIQEIGFKNSSTPEICRKAGVSRGALLHHFPTKEVLIANAVEKLLKEEIQDLYRIGDAYSHHELTIEDFVDNLWERFSGRLFMITIDFLSSARTDEKLRKAIVPVSLDFHTSLNKLWLRFFKHPNMSADQVQLLLNTTLCLMRGMGVQTIIRNDPEYYDHMRNYWKSFLHTQLNQVKGDKNGGANSD